MKTIVTLPRLVRIDRRFLIRRSDWYGGSAWFILNRQLCEYVVDTREVREYRWFFKNTEVPVESFFQTVIMNSEHRDTVVNDNKRMITWDDNSPAPTHSHDPKI